MIEVSTFSDFLTAIAGTEDVVLTADIDAEAEGYGSFDSFEINCNLDGQGHTISNISIVNSQGVYFKKNSAVIQNVYFRNTLVKSTYASCNCISALNNLQLKNSYFVFRADGNAGMVNAFYGSSTYQLCFFDIEVKNSNTFQFRSNSTIILQQCNVIVREANISTNMDSSHYIYFDFCAIVFDSCHFSNSRMMMRVRASTYVSVKNCTSDNVVTFTNETYGLMLVCDDSADMTCIVTESTKLKTITPENLESESYLNEIGFMP